MKKLLSIVAAAIFMVSCGMTDKAKQVDKTLSIHLIGIAYLCRTYQYSEI